MANEGNWRFKQVIVIRSDLKMGKGKTAVQCSHAAVSAAEEARKKFTDWWQQWFRDGQPKIAVKSNGIDTILHLEKRASSERLPHFVVRDAGLTQLEPGTITCIGIGPAPTSRIDALTGEFSLL